MKVKQKAKIEAERKLCKKEVAAFKFPLVKSEKWEVKVGK